jgi:hypothetical protein
MRSSLTVSRSLAADGLGCSIVVEKGCAVVVSIDLRGPSTALLANCASSFAQDDGILGGLEER